MKAILIAVITIASFTAAAEPLSLSDSKLVAMSNHLLQTTRKFSPNEAVLVAVKSVGENTEITYSVNLETHSYSPTEDYEMTQTDSYKCTGFIAVIVSPVKVSVDDSKYHCVHTGTEYYSNEEN